MSVLVLSQVVEPTHAVTLISERPEGFGYLLKDRVLEIDDFLDAVRRVAGGGTAIDPCCRLGAPREARARGTRSKR